MIKFTFTYQTVTPELAEYGDFAEHGFIDFGHWTYPMDENGEHGYDVEHIWGRDGLTLSDVINFAQSLGICYDSGSDWIESIDPDHDYQTGAETTYALHIEGCSDSTKRRIHALLS